MRRLGLALSAVVLLAAGFPTAAAPADKKDWYVTFSVAQRGIPAAPKPPQDLTTTTSTLKGRILFAKRPKPGKAAGGTVKVTLRHEDEFTSQKATLKIRLKDGRCTLGADSSSLFLTGAVRRVVDPGGNWGLAKKDPAVVRLTDNGTENDVFSFIASDGQNHKHTHAYESSSANTLAVVIGDPKRL